MYISISVSQSFLGVSIYLRGLSEIEAWKKIRLKGIRKIPVDFFSGFNFTTA